MANIFIISDTHFGHDNLYNFRDYEGLHIRNGYHSSEQCDADMIANWNRVVGHSDKVYHLGDIAMSKKPLLSIMPRLNGTKVLIKGNHDREKLSVYSGLVKDIRACHNLDGFLLTHVPIHPDSITRWKMNVHGHTHVGIVNRIEDGHIVRDIRYFNACVEVNGYSPVPFETIRELHWKQWSSMR